MSIRTITLSDRAPVKIVDEDWPLIAIATDRCHDGKVRSQANRASEWSIRVRRHLGRHLDGSTIVYAVYAFDTQYSGERNINVRHGELLPAGEDVALAIKRVCARMAAAEHHGDDAQRWARLCDECIADQPAEEMS